MKCFTSAILAPICNLDLLLLSGLLYNLQYELKSD